MTTPTGAPWFRVPEESATGQRIHPRHGFYVLRRDLDPPGEERRWHWMGWR